MKVYIMTDLEGVAGVINSRDWCFSDARCYPLACQLLTEEVNAAIDGFFAAGADEIVVQDGHGDGAIDVLRLDPRVKLQRGWHGPFPFGMDESFDVLASIGQHPKAGTEYGHLCHTGTMRVIDYSVNGVSIGEFGQLTLMAAHFGLTPIFASGCLAFTKEAKSLVDGIETVAVKEGVTPGSGEECMAEEYRARNAGAIHVHPTVARRMIREGAEKALLRYRENKNSFSIKLKLSAPFSKRVVYRKTEENPNVTVKEFEGFADPISLLNAK